MDHYYFHIGDYRRKTIHLTHEEHYMYRWLIDEYFLTEKPITTNIRMLMRKIGLTSDQETTLRQLLEEFFILEDDGWYHKHVEQVMARVHAKSRQSKSAINTRWERERSLRKENERNTDVIRTNNGSNTDDIPTNNQLPITKNQKTKKGNGRFAPPTVEQVQTYLDERKVKSFTGSYFCDHYIARGWKLSHGKQMSDWKAAVRTWEQKPWNKTGDSDDYGKGAI